MLILTKDLKYSFLLGVSVEIVYARSGPVKEKYIIKAPSSISDLVDMVKLSIEFDECSWKLKNEDIVLTSNDKEIKDWSLPVVSFPLDAFKISEHSVLLL